MTGFMFTSNGPAPGTAPTPDFGTGNWLLPGLSHDARVYQSAGILTGQPGTMPIPAPDAAAVPPGNLPTMARGPIAWPLRGARSSRDAPDVILPALYYQRVLPNPDLAPDVSVISDNQMPVPAVDPRGRPAVMFQRPSRIGGRAQVPQPYNLTSWPKWDTPAPLAPS